MDYEHKKNILTKRGIINGRENDEYYEWKRNGNLFYHLSREGLNVVEKNLKSILFNMVILLSMEFSNPRIIKLIYNVIRQGRADTPKEAINVMLQDTHRTEMKLIAAQTAAAASFASINSGVAAAFCAASFFLR